MNDTAHDAKHAPRGGDVHGTTDRSQFAADELERAWQEGPNVDMRPKGRDARRFRMIMLSQALSRWLWQMRAAYPHVDANERDGR